MEAILERCSEVLAASPGRWTSLVTSIPAELLARKPGPKEWSALECLQHLVDTERQVFQLRLRAFREAGEILDFDPDEPGLKPDPRLHPPALAEEFSTRRMESLEAVAQLRPADVARTAHHDLLGVVTLEAMLHQWAAHDLMHTVQAERALMQPFILGAGPWQPTFSDHFVRGSS